MRLGFIGLGRMGANMVRRLVRDGHEIHVYNRTPEKSKEIEGEGEGAKAFFSIADLVASLEKPRAVWVMVPAGDATEAQIDEGRSWLWEEDGVILFKAEASAWTRQAVQLQQVWTDPEARGAGNAGRGLRDLIRLLLERVPTVCLFVRADNRAAIALYDSVGMSHVLDYRSVLL